MASEVNGVLTTMYFMYSEKPDIRFKKHKLLQHYEIHNEPENMKNILMFCKNASLFPSSS